MTGRSISHVVGPRAKGVASARCASTRARRRGTLGAMRTLVTALAAIVGLGLGLAIEAAPPARAQPAAPRFAPGTKPADIRICVNPLGKVDEQIAASVARGITAAYGF